MSSNFAISSVDVRLPLLGPQQLKLSTATGSQNRSTIVVGRNGSGKSTILRDVTMALRSYFATQKLKSRQGINSVSKIEIAADDHIAVINVNAKSSEFLEQRDRLRELGLAPSRLIALSFTPFDKFPPADETRDARGEWEPDPFYVYLGHKSEFRYSPRSRLMRSIDNLTHAKAGPEKGVRIVRAFLTLGYKPAVRLRYQLQPGSMSRVGPSRSPSTDPGKLELFLSYASNRSSRGELRYEIDFGTGRHVTEMPVGYDDIRSLARDNVVRLMSVTLERSNGEMVEMLDLSSGELNLLSGFLGLAAYLQDGSLILIDEPENSLHPQWQLDYASRLEDLLSQYSGCHYIVATHSPLIVSGMSRSTSSVLRLDQLPILVPGETVAAQSPDATLMNAFQVVTEGNSHIKQVVLELLTFLEMGNQQDGRALELAAYLQKHRPLIPETDAIGGLVDNVVTAVLSR